MIISWTLYPWPSGSSVIVNNIASQFSQDQLVMLGEEYPNETQDSWPENFPKIHYVNPNLSIGGRGQTHFRWLNIRKVINKICKVAKAEKVDKLLCIFPDDFYLYTAYRVSKKMNIPLYTWFHNTYVDNYSGYRKLFANWFQPKVFNVSQKIFVMSDGMNNYYKSKYPKYNFETLVHGFILPKNEFSIPKVYSNQKITFAYIGSFNESCRDAALRLAKVISRNLNFELHVFGKRNAEAFKNYGIKESKMKVYGFLSEIEFHNKLCSCDIMLLPHGFDGKRTQVEYNTIFPTRTIPLLVSGKPILAHSPKDVFLTSFINEHDCALNVDTKSEEAINNAIDLLCNDKILVERLVKNAYKASKKFQLENVVAKLKKSLEN